FISIKIAEHFLLDGSLLIFNYCSVTAVTFWKRRQWKELVENLKVIAEAEIWSSVVVFIGLQFFGTHLYLLKDTVDIFNDIFGWPIFFIIVYTTLHILNHFDNIFA
ncbi:unnamed protein product, partial [Tenebrio molitor]